MGVEAVAAEAAVGEVAPLEVAPAEAEAAAPETIGEPQEWALEVHVVSGFAAVALAAVGSVGSKRCSR